MNADTITVDGTRVTLTPGAHPLTIASQTTPGHTWQMLINTDGRYVTAVCQCPAFINRGRCKHTTVLLDVISLQLHGHMAAPGAVSVPSRNPAPLTVTGADLFDVS